MTPTNIAIFASGTGTNAENIIRSFNTPGSAVRVALVVTNRSDAPVIQKAEALGVPAYVLDRQSISSPETMLPLLRKHGTGMIVLAGFLLLVPAFLIREYPIINIHPALLPKFGGKGMYGMNVHKAVVDAREPRTGITIHFVSEEYDKGEILFQASVDVLPDDTPEMVAQKVHQLEYTHYPTVIKEAVMRRINHI
jgi:phosphoribosylglycinamide formyltransferase-1